MNKNERQSDLESESEFDIYKSYDSGHDNKNSYSQEDAKSFEGFHRLKSNNYSDLIKNKDEANNNQWNNASKKISMTVKVHTQPK